MSLQNTAAFADQPGGLAQLVTQTWTRITNKKRRAVMAALVLRQVNTIEKLVHAMPYEEVESLCARLAPHASKSNGAPGSLQIPSEQPLETVEIGGGDKPQIVITDPPGT